MRRRTDVENQFRNALNLKECGGYGEFTDDGVKDMFLCHDCAVEFYRFMGFKPEDGYAGCHPYTFEDGPCCEYGWSVDRTGDEPQPVFGYEVQ